MSDETTGAAASATDNPFTTPSDTEPIVPEEVAVTATESAAAPVDTAAAIATVAPESVVTVDAAAPAADAPAAADIASVADVAPAEAAFAPAPDAPDTPVAAEAAAEVPETRESGGGSGINPIVAAAGVAAVAAAAVAVAAVASGRGNDAEANAASAAPASEEADDIQMMPPLDEIEVPGSGGDEGEGRGGGGRGGGRRGGGGGRFSSSMGDLKTGDVITGTVVKIDNDGVLVDVGTKSEGLVRPNELTRDPVQNMADVVAVGDKIDVLVLSPEGRDGTLLLSKKRADFEKAWDRVQEALADGRTIQAMVSDRVKGGLVVDLGIRGFVPASHVGNGKLKNLDKFLGQSIPLKVLEVDREHRKVVLSHRLATEEEREKQKQDTLGSLAEGQTRTGVVRRVTDYGAFVDLGGIDGLLHVSEMSWTRVKHPSDVVKVGQEVQVMILKLNLEGGRISLGMRQILPDPWEEVGERYHVGDVVEGEVTRLVPFGAFVLLEGGIEGIIPNSELSHRRGVKPADVVDTGQRVEVKVIDVRPEERRLTLSLRALQPREAGQDDYRSAPRGVGGGGPAAPGAAPATEEGPGGGRREKRDRRRRGDDDDAGGGDYRQYMSSRSEPRLTLGDMFGDMLTGSRGGGGGGAAGGGGKRGGRRGRQEEEEEDFSDLDLIDEDIDATAEDTGETGDAEGESEDADKQP